jgi:hypothetical protein
MAANPFGIYATPGERIEITNHADNALHPGDPVYFGPNKGVDDLGLVGVGEFRAGNRTAPSTGFASGGTLTMDRNGITVVDTKTLMVGCLNCGQNYSMADGHLHVFVEGQPCPAELEYWDGEKFVNPAPKFCQWCDQDEEPLVWNDYTNVERYECPKCGGNN